MNNFYWQLPDGKIWGGTEGGWVNQELAGHGTLSLVDDVDQLRARIKLYGGDLGELATAEDLQKRFTDGIQIHLDDFARTRNYDGIMSAATYAASAVPKFRAEGQYAVEARDAIWAQGYEILAEVMSGERPMPTLEEVIAELPPLAWPD